MSSHNKNKKTRNYHISNKTGLCWHGAFTQRCGDTNSACQWADQTDKINISCQRLTLTRRRRAWWQMNTAKLITLAKPLPVRKTITTTTPGSYADLLYHSDYERLSGWQHHSRKRAKTLLSFVIIKDVHYIICYRIKKLCTAPQQSVTAPSLVPKDLDNTIETVWTRYGQLTARTQTQHTKKRQIAVQW